MKLNVFSVFILVASIEARIIRYGNYKIYRVIPKTDEQLRELKNLQFDFKKRPTTKNSSVDIILNENECGEFYDFVKRTKIEYDLRHQTLEFMDRHVLRTNHFGWTEYWGLDTMYRWLDSLPKSYPNVSVIVIGKSYEGRLIKGVKLSHRKGNKVIFLEGGIHSREWISPATVTYILNQLLTSNNPAIRQIAQNYDWHIFPVVNPDGYQYTFSTDRLWRKTRQPHGDCIGADANRNWPYLWLKEGASTNPCKITYAGPAPFSEPETYALAEYIASLCEEMVVYVSFHSYGQFLLLPYGHTKDELDNYNEAKQIGRKALKSLQRRYGTKYQIGNIAEMVYYVTGSTIDWVKHNYEVPLVYAFELPDTNEYGFELPEKEIIPTGLETMDAMVTMMQEAENLGILRKIGHNKKFN